MLKVDSHPDYPPEEGRYIRGNDFSPVAVAIVLNCDADKIPPDLEVLVRVGVEAGAALSGTVQTENIGAVEFRGYSLYDPGAYPAPPLGGKITWRVTQPWAEPPDQSEREALARAMEMIERLRESSKREEEASMSLYARHNV